VCESLGVGVRVQCVWVGVGMGVRFGVTEGREGGGERICVWVLARGRGREGLACGLGYVFGTAGVLAM